MSDENISEEVIKRALRTHVVRRLFPGEIEGRGGFTYRESLLRDLLFRRDDLTKVITVDWETLKKAATEEIRNVQSLMESFFQEVEKRKRAVEKELIGVDKVISAFPNISRNDLILSVEGKMLSYEVNLLSGSVKAFCPGKHRSESVCVRLKDQTTCTACKRESEPVSTPFQDITDKSIQESVQIAINLANDQEIDELSLLRSIYRILICPKCFKERKFSVELLDKLCDKIASLEEQKAENKYCGDYDLFRLLHFDPIR